TGRGGVWDLMRTGPDEPVQACPPSAAYRLRKLVRRNSSVMIAASLVLLALVGGIIGTTIGLIRAENARDAETVSRQAALDNEKKALGAAAAERKATETALAREAEAQAHRLAWQSAATRSSNPGLALLLAIESAQRATPNLTTRNTLLAALEECREIRTFAVKQASAKTDPWNFAVTSAVYSVDGTRLVTTSNTVERRPGLYGKPAWTLHL